MKHFFALCSAVLLFLLPKFACAEKHALLIALGTYEDKKQFKPLLTAVNAAKVLARTLQEVCEFPESNTTLLTSEEKTKPTRQNILVALEALKQRVKQGDVVFVYYYGHGTDINRETYLSCYDSIANTVESEQNNLRASDIPRAFRGVPATLIISAFETCRSEISDANEPTLKRDLLFTPVGTLGIPGAENAVALFSGKSGTDSVQFPEKNMGAFSYALNNALRGMAADKDGIVRVRNVIAYLEKAVPSSAMMAYSAMQIPQSLSAGKNPLEFILTQGFPPQSGGRTAVPLKVNDTPAEQYEAEMQRGVELELQEKYAEAAGHYRKALEHRPDSTAAHLSLGRRYFFLKQYDEAKIHFDRLVQINPESHAYYAYLGIIEQERGNIKEAEEFYKKALRGDKRNPMVCYHYGNLLYFNTERYVEAEKLLRTALEVRGNDAYALYVLGLTLKVRGEKYYDEAEESFRTAMRLMPESKEIIGGTAQFLHYQRKSYDEAEQLYKQILPTDTAYSLTLGFWGHLKGKIRKDYQVGEEMLRKAIILNKTIGFFHLALAEVLDAQGKTEEARAELKETVKLKGYDKNYEIFERLGVKPEATDKKK